MLLEANYFHFFLVLITFIVVYIEWLGFHLFFMLLTCLFFAIVLFLG
jgi:hypothetical protein